MEEDVDLSNTEKSRMRLEIIRIAQKSAELEGMGWDTALIVDKAQTMFDFVIGRVAPLDKS